MKPTMRNLIASMDRANLANEQVRKLRDTLFPVGARIRNPIDRNAGTVVAMGDTPPNEIAIRTDKGWVWTDLWENWEVEGGGK